MTGILVELYYPGAPMGQIHNSEGKFTGPMNWQHATMYFFFGISGLADVISYSARHVVPPGWLYKLIFLSITSSSNVFKLIVSCEET